MTLTELKEKALSLPYEPGVYIMRDKNNSVIYVGKAKMLKNRVSQYFQDSASHTPKTKMMVSKIDHFDVIVAASEFEALVLECSLIKRHMPKYNILLKDGKGYPYLRLNMKENYPTITMVSKADNDGADYFGPYGNRGVTQNVLETIQLALKLPVCGKRFPKDIGKGRPCLNYHLNQCSGWCQGSMDHTEYRRVMEQARQLLMGNYRHISESIQNQMLQAADSMNFELAAVLRNRMKAVEALGQRQFVTAGVPIDTDAIGYAETEAKACFAVLHFSGGNLIDKDYEVFNRPDDAREAVLSLLQQYYLNRGVVPKRILLPFDLEDAPLFASLLTQHYNRKVQLILPQRGDNTRFAALANKNAFEEAIRVTGKDERSSGTLNLLGQMLAIEPPKRIESFDISNISGTDIVASMVVFMNGRPHKSDYKRFKIRTIDGQDDYAAMREVIMRRFTNYLESKTGFLDLPDLLLIDGGINHAKTAQEVLFSLGLDLFVIGMVKDDHHKTRALVTPEGSEIRIDNQQYVFSFVGTIQEETHRFAISYHRELRSKRLKRSELDKIEGIGPVRKKELLKHFKSIKAIENATVTDLSIVIPKNSAEAVYTYFQNKKKGSN